MDYLVLGVIVYLLGGLYYLLFKHCFKMFFSVPLLVKGLGCNTEASLRSFPKSSNRQIQSRVCRITSPDFWCL